MATPRTTIPDLPEQTTVVDANLLVVQDGTTTKKMTVGRLTTQASGALTAHLSDAVAAHAASAISAAPNTVPMTGTDVQSQLGQAAAAFGQASNVAATVQANLDAHINDAVDAHDASTVSLVPSPAPFDQIDVQAWISQASSSVALASTLNNHLVNPTDAHDASAISAMPSADPMTGADVQAQLGQAASGLAALQVGIDALDAVFTASMNGLAPASGGSGTDFLCADGTWTAPAGGGGGGITTEDAVDAVAAALVAGNNVDITYNDASNTITVDVEALTSADIPGLDTTLATKAPLAQTIETAAGTTYAVVAADSGKIKRMTGTATVTLPSGGPAVGERVDFVCVGGPATFALGGGATWDVAPTPSAVARAIGSVVSAVKMGATTWLLTGDLA